MKKETTTQFTLGFKEAPADKALIAAIGLLCRKHASIFPEVDALSYT